MTQNDERPYDFILKVISFAPLTLEFPENVRDRLGPIDGKIGIELPPVKINFGRMHSLGIDGSVKGDVPGLTYFLEASAR